MILKLGPEEELLRALRAVVRSCRQAMFQYMGLKSWRGGEYRATYVAREIRATSERVLYQMSLQLI